MTSKRLAGLASRVARKRARGAEVPEFPVVNWTAPTSNPWASVPEEQREKRAEVLHDGTLSETYVDTVESLRAKQRAAPVAPKAEPSEPILEPLPPRGPLPTAKSPAEASPFASYPMPGHKRG